MLILCLLFVFPCAVLFWIIWPPMPGLCGVQMALAYASRSLQRLRYFSNVWYCGCQASVHLVESDCKLMTLFVTMRGSRVAFYRWCCCPYNNRQREVGPLWYVRTIILPNVHLLVKPREAVSGYTVSSRAVGSETDCILTISYPRSVVSTLD